MHLQAQLERDLKRAFDVTLLDHGILLMLRNTPGGLTMGHLASQFGTEAKRHHLPRQPARTTKPGQAGPSRD